MGFERLSSLLLFFFRFWEGRSSPGKWGGGGGQESSEEISPIATPLSSTPCPVPHSPKPCPHQRACSKEAKLVDLFLPLHPCQALLMGLLGSPRLRGL